MKDKTLYTAFNETKTLEEWSQDKRCEINYGNLRKRINDGLSIHKALIRFYQWEELKDKTFGFAKIIKIHSEKDRCGYSRLMAHCICTRNNCQKTFTCRLEHLKNGTTSSCGCWQLDRVKEANKSVDWRMNKRLYGCILNANERCYNINNKQYEDYGARGIEIAKEWRRDKYGGVSWKEAITNFKNWAEKQALKQGISLEDLKNKRNGLQCYYTLDRIDNDGSYSPENCKWSNKKDQLANTRKRIKNNDYQILQEKYNELFKENENLKKQLAKFVK